MKNLYLLLIFVIIFPSKAIFAQATSDGVVFEDVNTPQQLPYSNTPSAFPFNEGRDPFIRVLDNMGLVGDTYTREKYNLGEFKLVGIVWGTENPVALFKGPNGERHVLRKGDNIGRNGGILKEISKGQVEVIETFAGIQKPTIIKVGKTNGNS